MNTPTMLITQLQCRKCECTFGVPYHENDDLNDINDFASRAEDIHSQVKSSGCIGTVYDFRFVKDKMK